MNPKKMFQSIYVVFQVTETRPLSTRLYCNPDRDSDGSIDQDNKSYPRERTTFNSLSSRFSDIWGTDLDRKKGLFTRSLGLEFKQRKAEQRHATDDCIVNRTGQVQTKHKEGEPDDNSGGKLCHPKMRAKLLFRSGEFNDKSWGYQLEQTEADDTMESNDIENNEKSFDLETPIPENDSSGNYLPVVENISPVPFSDAEMNDNTFDTDSNNNANRKDLNGNVFSPVQFDADVMNNLNGNAFSPIQFDACVTDSPLTTNSPVMPESITDNSALETIMDKQNLTELVESKTGYEHSHPDIHMNDSVMELESSVTGKESVMKDKPHEYDIWVTEVTHDCLTVTFMESPTEKGFFKRSFDA